MPAQRRDEAQRQAELTYTSGQDKLNVDDYDGAIADFKKAAALDPENQEYISMCGSILAEVGRHEEAIQILEAAVQRFPNVGYEKYMYLGQLLSGEQGIQSIQKGLTLLKAAAEQETDVEEKKALQSQIASGICSMVEMRMEIMDDCDPNEVAQACEPLLLEAIQTDAQSPEPKQVLASLRNEQGRSEEALQVLKASMALWYRRPEDEDGGAEQNLGNMSVDELACPSYEFRFETAKLLVELDETTVDAIEILEDLLHEHDTDLNVVYLLALAYHAGGDHENALEYVGGAETLLADIKPGSPEAEIKTRFIQLKEQIEEMSKLSKDVMKLG